jgi:hypothetical protein
MEQPSPKPARQHKLGQVERSLLTVDSAIRNGQFVYALRETNKLLGELTRGEASAGDQTPDVMASVKRTSLFLKPMVEAYAQNQRSIGLLSKGAKCRD